MTLEEEIEGGPPGLEALEDEYPDYNATNSRVISGPLGATRFPGTRHRSWKEAKAYVQEHYTVVKFWTMPGRWFARIKREGHEA